MRSTSDTRLRVVGWIAAACLALPRPAWPGNPATDYDVKAAFLLHFTRLVEWPGGSGGAPIVVAVLGNEPFADVLAQAARAHPAKAALRIVRGDSVESLGEERPHVLFIGTDNATEASRVCAAVGAAPMLTVGDVPGFAQRGGMIGFRVTEDGRVTFDVNLARSQAAGLKVSSQLLKVARLVGEAER